LQRKQQAKILIKIFDKRKVVKGIPQEMEELARASIYRAFFRIILPILTPTVATIMILQFLGTWNEFLLAYILFTKETLRTLPIGLVYFQGQYATDWGGVGAGHDYCQLVNGYLIFILHRSKWNVLNG
jgi:ABC-type glycerol-3-phosphate transport system permease component